MRTKTPLQEKTPFAIDGKPMEGLLTAQASLAAVSRAFRSLGAPKLCDGQVRIKERSRGFTAGQQVESLVLLHQAGLARREPAHGQSQTRSFGADQRDRPLLARPAQDYPAFVRGRPMD